MINTKPLKIICISLLLLLCASYVQAGTFSVNQLINQISINKPTKVNYSQQQYLHFLKDPIMTQGEFYFRPPSHIEQRVLSPKFQHFIIDKEEITITNAEGTHTADLREYPNVWTMIMTLNAVLTNHTAFLKNYYYVKTSGNSSSWMLTLIPKIQTNSKLLQIKLAGKKDKINTILIQYKNGDWTMQKLTQTGSAK